jgi:histidyl-tRNA synthetase
MEGEALVLAHRLRREGYVIELGYRGNMSRRMKRANRLKARAAIILGPDEAARGTATLRDFDSGAQEEVSLASLSDRLAPYR